MRERGQKGASADRADGRQTARASATAASDVRAAGASAHVAAADPAPAVVASVAAAALRRVPLGAAARLSEAYFAVCLLAVLAFALFTHGDDLAYDITFVHAIAVAAASSCAVYLIERRAAVARRFVVCSLAAVLALGALDALFGSHVARLAAAFGGEALAGAAAVYVVATVAVAAYFACSPRMRRVLVLPLEGTSTALEMGGGHAGDARTVRREAKTERKASEAAGAIHVTRSAKVSDALDASGEGEVKAERRFSWPGVRNLVIFYCVFTILGHWAEIAFCWGIVFGVFMGDYDFSHAQLWSQWLYPYPAHGIALVLIVLLLYPLSRWLLRAFRGHVLPALVVSFLANALVCTTIDFTTGITANADYQLWDYRDLPFNFMGQVVLQNSIAYSIAATLIVWVVYPLMATGLKRAPKGVVDAAFFAMIGAYAFLEVLYFVNVGPAGLVFG